MNTPTIKAGQRVKVNGRVYQAWRDSHIDEAPRSGVDYTGKEVVWLRPINAKTGEAWQASRLRLVSECSAS